MGSFGDDELGDLSRASLTGAGVDVSLSRTVSGATNQFAIVIVDAADKVRGFLPQLDELVTEGLVILDEVEVIRYVGRRAQDRR